MGYKDIKLDKSMYKASGGFLGALEKMDPDVRYAGTEMAGLDAFERQLRRFGIKVSGAGSSTVAKFFETADSAHLFPEYVSRAVAKGADEAGVISEIIASKTECDSLDYRSITVAVEGGDLSPGIAEGAEIPAATIELGEKLVRMKKRGRMLSASYEAIRFQRTDVITVALSQIGAHIAKAQLRDAVGVLLGDGVDFPIAQEIRTAGAQLSYADMLALWALFEDFKLDVLLAAPDMTMAMLGIEEFRDPACGLHFQSTGRLSTPLGATLISSAAVPEGTIIGLDRRFALEMVSAGGVVVEHDKLIDTQLERAAVTCISGFSKLFPEAVKVLKKK